MTNNEILRRVRYTFDFKDQKLIEIFALADHLVSLEEVQSWFLREEDPEFVEMKDIELATFLNGLISEKRGKREGEQPVPEKRLSNNLILKKLKIALHLRSNDIIDVLKLAGFRMSEHELSAFFRKPGHKHYRNCKDQIVRNFLQGILKKYRPKA